jgi:hypothetical protein
MKTTLNCIYCCGSQRFEKHPCLASRQAKNLTPKISKKKEKNIRTKNALRGKKHRNSKLQTPNTKDYKAIFCGLEVGIWNLSFCFCQCLNMVNYYFSTFNKICGFVMLNEGKPFRVSVNVSPRNSLKLSFGEKFFYINIFL